MTAGGVFGKFRGVNPKGVTITGPPVEIFWGNDEDERVAANSISKARDMKRGFEITFELAVGMNHSLDDIVAPFYEMICLGHSPEVAASIVGFELPQKKWCRTIPPVVQTPYQTQKKPLAIKLSGLPQFITSQHIYDLLTSYTFQKPKTVRFSGYDDKIAYISFYDEPTTKRVFEIVQSRNPTNKFTFEQSIISLEMV